MKPLVARSHLCTISSLVLASPSPFLRATLDTTTSIDVSIETNSRTNRECEDSPGHSPQQNHLQCHQFDWLSFAISIQIRETVGNFHLMMSIVYPTQASGSKLISWPPFWAARIWWTCCSLHLTMDSAVITTTTTKTEYMARGTMRKALSTTLFKQFPYQNSPVSRKVKENY